MPLIEDAGKGEGVKTPSAENGEGLTAGRFAVLHLGAAAAQIRDPAKLALLKQKEELEAQIDDLKYRKASMAVQEYRGQLQQLLLRTGEDAGGARQISDQSIEFSGAVGAAGRPHRSRRRLNHARRCVFTAIPGRCGLL